MVQTLTTHLFLMRLMQRALGVVLFFFLLAAHAQQIPTCTIIANPTVHTGQTPVTLTWSTANAVVCVASGGWSGVRDCAGGSVTFPVSQSRNFILTVKAATGKVTARYTKPSQNEDGSPATITGFKLYVADSAADVPNATPINLPASPLEYVFWRAPGPVSASVKSVRADGVTSNFSGTDGKTVVAATGTCSASVTINPLPKAPSLTISWLKRLFTPNT